MVVVFATAIALKPIFPQGLPPGAEGRAMLALIWCFGLAVAHVVAVALLERAEWGVTGLGAAGWRPLAVALGAGLGAVPMLALGAALVLGGWFDAEPSGPGAWGVFALAVLVPVLVRAAFEELLLRGYVIGVVQERLGPIVALACTALASLPFHGGMPGVPWRTWAVAGAIGLFLGAVRLATGSVAASFLAHVGLHWVPLAVLRMDAPALGVPTAPGFRLVPDGPAWLVGGARGLEQGAAAAALLLLITFLLLRVQPADRVGPRRR